MLDRTADSFASRTDQKNKGRNPNGMTAIIQEISPGKSRVKDHPSRRRPGPEKGYQGRRSSPPVSRNKSANMSFLPLCARGAPILVI